MASRVAEKLAWIDHGDVYETIPNEDKSTSEHSEFAKRFSRPSSQNDDHCCLYKTWSDGVDSNRRDRDLGFQDTDADGSQVCGNRDTLTRVEFVLRPILVILSNVSIA